MLTLILQLLRPTECESVQIFYISPESQNSAGKSQNYYFTKGAIWCKKEACFFSVECTIMWCMGMISPVLNLESPKITKSSIVSLRWYGIGASMQQLLHSDTHQAQGNLEKNRYLQSLCLFRVLFTSLLCGCLLRLTVPVSLTYESKISTFSTNLHIHQNPEQAATFGIYFMEDF